ncbi:claudin-4-like [Phodopus roborovskii]|uniref:claudin-4-like n=1 Tax=Phodopus roborovskii TaxID=109678 RepID=UPI0021E4D458|nr:claudin-4-like [Phodopus roborovskii]
MAPLELEAASFSLAMLAWIGTIVCCWLPKWRVKEISECTVIWEGLWNLCEADKLQSLKCMMYNSRLVQPHIANEEKIMMAASVLFLGFGLLLLVSASWVTHDVILGIANLQTVSQRKPEMGASLYLGWLSSLLLLLGGALLGAAHLWCEVPTNNDSPVFQRSSPLKLRSLRPWHLSHLLAEDKPRYWKPPSPGWQSLWYYGNM